eukprot:XP_015582387.1 uncharacterized protein LOC8273518 [Ricinus communis]
MMVANSFDLWQKDSFFSAAEEVQASADLMQSAYRMWVREKEGSNPEDIDELFRELQTSLGTAKWQLEEFERAVRLSHGHRNDDITASRHKQFVAAIESQISHVEAALREAYSEDGKKPLQWVHLNKEECDDLALFLSGAPQTPKSVKDDCNALRPCMKSPPMEKNYCTRKDADYILNATCSGSTSNERDVSDVTSCKNDEFIIDVEDRDISRMRDDIICQADKTSGTRRIWSSPNFGALKVVIADEDEHDSRLSRIDATPKEKGSKPLFWKQKCGEFSRAKGPSSMFNQLFGQVGGFQRQLQSPLPMQFSCSVQLTLALMLSIFLIVPFLVYSA